MAIDGDVSAQTSEREWFRGADDPWPSAEEIEAIFPDWEMTGTASRGGSVFRQSVRHRSRRTPAILLLSRRFKGSSWAGKKPKTTPEHLVPILEWGSAGDDAYVIYEEREGASLGEALEAGEVSRKLLSDRIGPQIDAALREAHELGLEVDTRPERILLLEDYRVLLRPLGEMGENGRGVQGDWMGERVSPGMRLGPYVLKEMLGEGGFAEVYLAEQHEPMRRDVALKILKLGMDSEEVLSRFEAERQALARLHHPYIASIYDAGATKQGRPYFVMERVDGVALTEYSEAHQLGLHEKLLLLQKLCQAVKHAHDVGIVHRDLKPGNVLVTEDAEGQVIPKVIDFGIAKATQQPLTAHTLHTRFYHLLGSLSYMSPEQAGMRKEVDQRADVYAIGCLFYELLTDRTPLGRATTALAPMDALALIRDDLPPPPSRAVEKGKRISRDLDAVVMKALEKDPGRRYESVSDLLADIDRVLAGEAVSVRSPGLAYKAQRAWRDRRVKGVSMACGGALFALVSVSLWPEAPLPPLEPIDFVARSRTADDRVVPVGLWQFDGGFANDLEGGAPMRVEGEPNLEFVDAEIGGEVAQVLSFPNFKVHEYLVADNPMPPNGWEFATDTNVYTLVMDVMFPELSRSTALMQASVGNSGGSEFVFAKDGRPWSRRGGKGSGKRIVPGGWHRLVFTAELRGQTQLTRTWIDGESASDLSSDGLVDSHIGLNEEVLFFAEGNGATSAGYVNSIALYDVVLTEHEIADLSGASASGIPRSMSADLREGTAPESVQLADRVITPPEPGFRRQREGRNHYYGVSLAGEDLLVHKRTLGGQSKGGGWVYRIDAAGRVGSLRPKVMPEAAANFGENAAIFGDLAVVSSHAETVQEIGMAGAVYAFRRTDEGDWIEVQRLVPAEPSVKRFFGGHLHLGPDVLLVIESGTRVYVAPEARVHVYERSSEASGDAWRLASTIKGPDLSLGSVAAFVDSESFFMKTGYGKFALYQKVGGEWKQRSEFQREGDVAYLANSMACDGETLLVGWPKQSGGRGEVLVFERDEGGENGWKISETIVAPLSAPKPRRFGSQLAVEENRVVVSCLSEDKRAVSFHQFERQGGGPFLEIALPLTVSEIGGHVVSVGRAATTTAHRGGQVLVHDLERWTGDQARVGRQFRGHPTSSRPEQNH